MRALVTYGSKRGGTAELAEMLAGALEARQIETVVMPPNFVDSLDGYDIVIVGGALYANRWHPDARRFVRRHRKELRSRAVWLFSSGPLGDAYQSPDIPPVRQVAALARKVGARGHVTFGGRLEPDASGVVAHSLAATMAGDWRDPAAIDRWAAEIVRELAAPVALGSPRNAAVPS
jgi:menaquinone-dependent protoporphyrinogen oxidase